YPKTYFRRRYRMRRKLFLKIVKGISTYEDDPLPAAIRQLAYGTTPDAFDEYLQMSERTARECLCIDCMHWEWRNCPVAWQGQYGRGDKKYPTIMLEAVASQDLWIWHAFFGMTGANNDINILDNSPLFDDLLNDTAHVLPYEVNGVGYEKWYYLADGIYPQWTNFVKSFMVANDTKHAYFKRRQEGARKDVERAFGVLQGRWGIIQQPARAYEVNTIRRIMYSCIIMHNMILKDQKMRVFDWNDNYANPSRNMQRTWVERCETQRRKNKEIRDRETHQSLQRNLMEHIWQQVEHEDEDF
ncbi:ALP1-like protein isoform X1, partial [Tanacetum coccineum]